MKALLYKNNGKTTEIPIEKIDTITSDGDGICISLANGQGEVFCKLLTFEHDDSKIKDIIDEFWKGEKS